LAFAISWSLWGSLFFIAPEGWDITASPAVLLPALLGGIGSSASGMIVIAFSQGRAGLRSLFGRLRQKAHPAWYILALSAVPLMLLTTLAFTGTPLDRDVASKIGTGAMIGGVAALIEEFGWRGFALPALQKKYGSVVTASIMLGAIWAFWHVVPSYWGSSASYGSLWLPSFLVFAFSLVAYSVFITWVFNRTKGNMLIAILLHAVYSGSQFVLFPLEAAPIENILLTGAFMAILWAIAGSLLVFKLKGMRNLENT
jgi:membrane protease YdiL (CAAX protease family)